MEEAEQEIVPKSPEIRISEMSNEQSRQDTLSAKSGKKQQTAILLSFTVVTIVIVMVLAGFVITKKVVKNQNPTPMSDSVFSPVPIPVPKTSASAITSPPPSMEGINTHSEVYGGGAEPNMITLGPKVGGHPGWTPYATKHSMGWELKIRGTPVLAPIDMKLVGFQNNSVQNGVGADGQKYNPMNDIVLFFESTSPDWPGMIIFVYHLYSSPLLRGHYQNPECGDRDGQEKQVQAQGHLYMGNMDYVIDKGNADACGALIGYAVKRGGLIGFAGSVGTHSFVDIGFKVSHTTENPTVQTGNRYLHWVQPGSFFYWKSYSPDANFPSGVLAYPFESDGYQLLAEQRDANFKYTSKKYNNY